jgi:NhaP-type Na+/H+ or K+/H+ antiporter
MVPSKGKPPSGGTLSSPKSHPYYLLSFLLLLATLTLTRAEGEEHTEDIPPAHAVLFPAFTLTIGVVAFYLLARYAHALPYTAVMFFVGALMGIGAELWDVDDHLNESLRLWLPIDSEVLLLIFLPGLIFKDSMGQNVHLFRIALPQLLIFAFPMVLAGAVLTALIAYYIFPYGWSFNLAMTFGSILAATDPVAVAVLLEQVGAPPRLKVHIAGEALLNDGAAIVFFSIFSVRFFLELGVEGLGEEVDWGRGVALFCRKALGGVAVGILFGVGLLTLMLMLDRRFNREENVVQVTATIAVAYLGYYVAEPVLEMSGVISTLMTGLIVKFAGRGMVNDAKLLDDFWTLVEHMLNTLLFTLGGAVWGAVIADGEQRGIWSGADWGYLIMLYILLLVIRGGLFLIAFPITSRIGLKTCWQETAFQVFGGLRGAVGIALALALDNEVNREMGVEGADIEHISKYKDQTTKLFAMVGGIAFITLTVNGSTAGPFLRRLGLADSTESRERIIAVYQVRFRLAAIDELVKLLAQPRFQHVNFALVRHHVPYLADLTRNQLLHAVEKHKETTLAEDYHEPYLARILPYLKDDLVNYDVKVEELAEESPETACHTRKVAHELRKRNRLRRRQSSTLRFMMQQGDDLNAKEFRSLFVSILKAGYEKQIADGELQDRHFLAIVLDQSLEFAAEDVANGKPLNDWEYVTLFQSKASSMFMKARNTSVGMQCMSKAWAKRAHLGLKYTSKQMKIERSLAFMAAHRYAQTFFTREFQNAESELSEAGKLIIEESQSQFKKAEAILEKYDVKLVEVAVSHKLCMILLNSAFHYIEALVNHGLLKDQEAEHLVEEIEESLDTVLSCTAEDHPGELQMKEGEEPKRKSIFDVGREDHAHSP